MRRCFPALILLLLLSLFARGQRETTITSTTELVSIPVIVTDSAGKPVRGLNQKDFRIQENGKDQRIASFEEVTAQRKPIRSSLGQNGLYTNRVNDDTALSIGIVLIDFANTRAANQYWVIRGIMSFLEKWKVNGGFQQPMMLAAITPQGLRIIHQATSDPAVLEMAMQFVKASPSPTQDNRQGISLSSSDPPRNADGTPIVSQRPNETSGDYAARSNQARMEAMIIDQMESADFASRQAAASADVRTTMWALQALANGVSGIPGRKVMIWSAEAFPFASVQASFQSPQWSAVHGASDQDPDIKALQDATLLALNRANIAVYPVSAASLLTPEFFDASWADRTLMTGAQWSRNFTRASDRAMEDKLNSHIVADETGGKTCTNTSNVADCLGRALDDASHYYLLTYYPDPKPKGPGLRHLKVDVARDKVNVRARNSYFYGLPPSTTAPKTEVTVALQSNLDYTALPLVLRFAGVRPGDGPNRVAQFMIGIDGRALGIDQEHGNRISLLVGTQARDGAPLMVQPIDTTLKADLIDQIRSKQLTHNVEVQVAPGKSDVRVVVRDNLTGRIGSITAPIEVQ